MTRLQELRCVGADAGGAGAADTWGGGAVDSAEEDSDSESDWEELPELGLPDPIGDSGLELCD